MGHPEDAFKLLTAESVEEAEVLASKLESLNNKRKGRVAAIVRSAKTKVKLMEDALLNNGSNLPEVIVTGDPEWSPALVGLAAGSLADAFGKVVCIWGREGTGTLKGSCRNGGTDNSVVKIFENAGDALLFYGGHDAAGGFAVSDEKVHTIANVLNTALQSCDSSYNSGDECALDIKKQLYDIKLTLGNVNNLILRDLRKLAPFGISNPKPILLFERVTIQIIRHFGKEQNHLEVYVKGVDGASRKASKFFATAHSFGKEIVEGRVIDLYANMEESSFAGRRTLELRIVDIV
jgi:single-stranded-DNA-specific exonuclease